MKKLLLTGACLLLSAPAFAGVGNPPGAPLDANGNVYYAALGNSITRPDRDPLPGDDTTQGYSVGDNWINSRQGTVWQAQRVTAGNAVWAQAMMPGTPIIDAVGATATSAYGVILLKKSYAGNAFQLTRASDSTTQNIGFVNGIADWATADSFCAATTCYVTTWYDQVGIYNLTQSVVADAPVISTFQLGGYLRGLQFSNLSATSATTAQYMSNSSFSGFAPNNFDVFTVAAPLGSATKNMYWCLCSGSSQYVWQYSGNNGNNPFLNGVGSTYSYNSGILVPSGPMPSVVEGYSDATNGEQGAVNDKIFTAAASTNTTVNTGLSIGAALGSYSYALTGSLYAVVLYPNSLTTAQRALFRQLSYQKFNIVPQLRANQIAIGDSIAVGFLTPPSFANYTAVAWTRYLRNRYRTYNMGIPGITGTTVAGYLSTWFPSGVSSGQNNLCTEYLGTNDITAGGTAASVYATKSTLDGFLASNGCGQVFTGTMLSRGSSYGTVGTALNSLMYAALPTGATGLMDFGGDPTMGAAGAYSNTALFQVDGIHPTVLGHSYMASDLLNTLGTSNLAQ